MLDLGEGHGVADQQGEAAPQRRLVLEQPVAPHGRVERTLGGEDLRPLVRKDLEKLVDGLPVLGEVLGRF